MRHLGWLSTVVGACVLAGTAAADEVASAERGAALTIGRPRVTARLVDGTAQVTVRYDVRNPGAVTDAADVTLRLPVHAQVTGLRHRVGGRWIPGRLLDATAAEARFQRYRDAPFQVARGAALLVAGLGVAELRLSYVPARASVAVEYTLVVPACRVRGRWLAQLPDVGASPAVAGGAAIGFEAATKALGDLGKACEPFGVADGLRAGASLAWWREPLATGVRSAVTTIGTGARLATVIDVSVGARLARAPVRPVVVFVVDASRSQGVDGIARQLTVIRGYLRHAADAQVQVVLVRRHAAVLFDRWLPAADAMARLDASAGLLTPGNGSNLDLGLVEAAQLLAGRAGPRRLVAFTDDRLRQSLDDQVLAGALGGLPVDAIAHVVIPTTGRSTTVTRADATHFGALVRPTGGITATVEVGADLAPLVELVRPTRIDEITLDATRTVAVSEGTSARWVTVGDVAPVVSGLIWGRPWSARLVASPAAEVRAARLILASGADLEQPELAVVAAIGQAASAATSWLADDPAWTPSGLPEAATGVGRSISSSGGGRGGRFRVSHRVSIPGSRGAPRPVPDDLAQRLAPRIVGCAATLPVGWRAMIEVETTGVEVVDVRVATTGIAAAADRARFDRCAVEAGWDLDLDDGYAGRSMTYAATLPLP